MPADAGGIARARPPAGAILAANRTPANLRTGIGCALVALPVVPHRPRLSCPPPSPPLDHPVPSPPPLPHSSAPLELARPHLTPPSPALSPPVPTSSPLSHLRPISRRPQLPSGGGLANRGMAPTAAFAWAAPTWRGGGAAATAAAGAASPAVCRPALAARAGASPWVRPTGRRVGAGAAAAAAAVAIGRPAASRAPAVGRRPAVTASASSEAPRAPEPAAVGSGFVKASTFITNLFPVWTAACALLGLAKPSAFLWLTTPYFTLSLGMLMLSMGITLTVEDFRRVLARFGAVIIGFLGCYGLMPLLALALAKAFKLPVDYVAGLVLVGSVNGGQASNLSTFIAKGDVALSVVMTTATTLGAIVMTPLLSQLLIGAVVPVDALGIAASTIQVVLLPIAVGMALNRYANRLVRAVLPFSPVVGVLATCLLVGSSVAQCAGPILAAGWALQLPIMLLHVVGGLIGYYLPAMAGYGEVVRRTTAIETAMKSSAFGFLLASLHFANFAARVPSAVSVVWMAIIGSTMAVVWRYIPVPKENGGQTKA